VLVEMCGDISAQLGNRIVAVRGNVAAYITLWKDVVRFTLQTIRFSVSRFPKKHNLLFPKTFGSFGTCTEKCTEFSQNHN